MFIGSDGTATLSPPSGAAGTSCLPGSSTARNTNMNQTERTQEWPRGRQPTTHPTHVCPSVPMRAHRNTWLLCVNPATHTHFHTPVWGKHNLDDRPSSTVLKAAGAHDDLKHSRQFLTVSMEPELKKEEVQVDRDDRPS